MSHQCHAGFARKASRFRCGETPPSLLSHCNTDAKPILGLCTAAAHPLASAAPPRLILPDAIFAIPCSRGRLRPASGGVRVANRSAAAATSGGKGARLGRSLQGGQSLSDRRRLVLPRRAARLRRDRHRLLVWADLLRKIYRQWRTL